MSRPDPLVSVVMPVARDRGGLRRSLDSVLAQTFPDWELVVVDDASQDGTRDALAEYARRDPRVVVVRNAERLRIPRSMNRGLDAARAGHVAVIDEGDAWDPAKLERQWARMRAEPELVMLGCQVTYRRWDGETTGRSRLPLDDAAIRRAFLRGQNPFFHPALLMRRSAALRYNPAADLVTDYELFLRLSFLGRLESLDEVLVELRYHAGRDGVSNRRAAAMFDQKAWVYAAWLELLRRGDRAAVAAFVQEGVRLPELPAPGWLRRRAFDLRFAGGATDRRGRALALKAAGLLLDPASLRHHLRSRLLAPASLRGAALLPAWRDAPGSLM